ncbi:hypothetical protein [Acidocella sp.]|uniref:VirB4 family type IV secretion/conjugal transfer ATPase n=1 Tax=Acidocella sp. TaxID=50710 RepID=UPI003CFD0B86
MGKIWSRLRRGFLEVADGLARELEDQWLILANGMEGFGLYRHAVYERDGIMFSEVAETLRLVVTGRYLPVPIVSGHMGDSIYTDRVICGRRGIEIRAPEKSIFGTVFSFREYPARTRPGMLNTLLSAPFPLVLAQSFAFTTRAQAQDRLALKSAQMVSDQDKAASQIEGLSEAADALASNEFVMGVHHLSLTVYGDSLAEIEDRGGELLVRAAEGTYLELRRGEASGMAPLRGLQNNRRGQGFSSHLDHRPGAKRRQRYFEPGVSEFRGVAQGRARL